LLLTQRIALPCGNRALQAGNEEIALKRSRAIKRAREEEEKSNTLWLSWWLAI
jgi:hypothetical protein